MSSFEEAQKIISDLSDKNLDEILRHSTFNNEVEESVRGHIHQELDSWFFFRKLAADCSRGNIALHGFAKLWESYASASFIEAHWLEKYLVQRGGRSRPTAIAAPKVEWPDSPVEPVGPVQGALNVQKGLLEDLERLGSLAGKAGDNSLKEIVESRFLHKKTKHVKDMADLLKQTLRVSKQLGVGIYHLDAELRHHSGEIPWGHCNDPDHIEKSVEEVATSLRHHGF